MRYCPLCGKEYEDEATCPADGATLILRQASDSDLVGRVLADSYRIEEKIGEGGMGLVFRGVQRPLGRDVAIKVLSPGMQFAPTMIPRFFQEAKLLSRLSHPNVVSIIDFGNTEDGMIYMVMEFLRGSTLREWVTSRGSLPPGEILRIMGQICGGVGAAHAEGLVHRDLKPDNVFIASGGAGEETVKILDFGIAKTMAGPEETRLTQTGFLVGTPGFVAPEQIETAQADARSDVYALGAILYFMATGHRPYQGQTPHSIIAQQLRELPAMDTGPLAHNPALARVVSCAMHVDPRARYQTPAQLLTDLGPVLGGPSTDASMLPTLPLESVEPATDPATAPTALLSDAPEGHGSPGEAGSRTGAGRSVQLFGVVAAVVLLALAGWWWSGRPDSDGRLGSDSSSVSGAAASDGGAVDVTTRGVSRDTITVGMSAAFSGASRELGRGMQLGIELCFEDINAQGGVHGRRLELVALDDGYEPGRAVSNMADLLLERRVFAILGNVGTPTAEVTLPLALEQKVPFFGAFTGAALLRKQPPDPMVYNFRASYVEEAEALVGYFVDRLGLDPSQVGVFAQEDAFGDAGYRGVTSSLRARGLGDDAPRFGYRRNTLDVERSAEEIRRAENLRAIILVATYRAAAALVETLDDPDGPLTFAALSFVGSGALAEELMELGPSYAEGMIVSQVVPHYEASEPGVRTYRELLQRFRPSEYPGFVSLEGYLAARVFVEGLERAGPELTIEGFVDAVEAIDDLDLGIGTEIRFGPERHQGSSRVWGTVLGADGQYRSLEL